MKIWREYTFEAAHWLPLVPKGHKCQKVHGHSYRVRVLIEGEPKDGMVMDFAEIDKIWEPCHNLLDHTLLNKVKGLENPTSENLARWVYNAFDGMLIPTASVEVSETERSGAIYP